MKDVLQSALTTFDMMTCVLVQLNDILQKIKKEWKVLKSAFAEKTSVDLILLW